MEEEISLVDLFKVIQKRIGLIINMLLLGLILATVYTYVIVTPKYIATSQLLVNRTQETEIIQRTDIDTNVQLINTYSDIIRNPIILDPVINQLNLKQTTEQLKEEISVTTAENSQVFSLQVTDDNPYQAANIANTISNVFRDDLDSIMNVDNVTIISTAVPNNNPVTPNNIVNMLIGTILGGMLGVGIVFLIEFLDTSVKDDKFISDELGWTNLGTISMMTEEEMKFNKNPLMLQRKNDSRTSRSKV